jgi:raffinose/stachyose/melibiose transport system permease protein
MSNNIKEPALSMKTMQLDKPPRSERPGAHMPGAFQRARSTSRRSSWTNYLYIVPIFLFILGFIYFAIIYTFYVSTLNWDGLSDIKIAVGLKNFIQIFQDPIFFGALRNTALFAILTISIQMILGLTMALLLRTQVVLKTVYKTIFFLPVVLAPAVIAYIFRHMLDANLGELNQFLTAIHLGSLAQSWLADPRFALFSLIGINVWEWTGFSFILYYAALTILDETLVEAARIDGANFLQTVWHVIFPLLRSTNFSLIILGVIGALKTFDIVWLTTGGGPGRATEFLPTYIYKKTILEFNAGYSAALSVMLLLIALVITIIQLRAYQRQGGANA